MSYFVNPLGESLFGKSDSVVSSEPTGLRQLAKEITSEVIRAQPENIYLFIANLLNNQLLLRDQNQDDFEDEDEDEDEGIDAYEENDDVSLQEEDISSEKEGQAWSPILSTYQASLRDDKTVSEESLISNESIGSDSTVSAEDVGTFDDEQQSKQREKRSLLSADFIISEENEMSNESLGNDSSNSAEDIEKSENEYQEDEKDTGETENGSSNTIPIESTQNSDEEDLDEQNEIEILLEYERKDLREFSENQLKSWAKLTCPDLEVLRQHMMNFSPKDKENFNADEKEASKEGVEDPGMEGDVTGMEVGERVELVPEDTENNYSQNLTGSAETKDEKEVLSTLQRIDMLLKKIVEMSGMSSTADEED